MLRNRSPQLRDCSTRARSPRPSSNNSRQRPSPNALSGPSLPPRPGRLWPHENARSESCPPRRALATPLIDRSAKAHGPTSPYGIGAAGYGEFLKERSDVSLHSVHGDNEIGGDLLVGAIIRQEVQHVRFAHSQRNRDQGAGQV